MVLQKYVYICELVSTISTFQGLMNVPRKYLIANKVFSRLGCWNGKFVLIARFLIIAYFYLLSALSRGLIFELRMDICRHLQRSHLTKAKRHVEHY